MSGLIDLEQQGAVDVNGLAQIIRQVDGNHTLGASALADAILSRAPSIAARQPVGQEPVAYLDIGAGGYTDVGSDLTAEQLSALPNGRHALGIIGTWGVDGYVPAAPPAQVDLLRRALPFLHDEGGKYEDDGSNEPLELAREIEALIDQQSGKGVR